MIAQVQLICIYLCALLIKIHDDVDTIVMQGVDLDPLSERILGAARPPLLVETRPYVSNSRPPYIHHQGHVTGFSENTQIVTAMLLVTFGIIFMLLVAMYLECRRDYYVITM